LVCFFQRALDLWADASDHLDILSAQLLRAALAVPEEPSEFAARFVGLGTETGLRYQLEIVEFLFAEEVLDEARAEIRGAA
jgi:hypothetical protein